MKNRHIEAFKSKIKIYLRGKNVNRYLLRLAKNHVSLLHLERISKEEVYVTIYYKDYALVSKLNTIYEIGIIEYGGLIKEKKKTIQNKWIILAVCVAIRILFLLSRMIFTIEIVTNDEQFKQQLLIELKQYHIEKYAFQKSYQELSKIKESILANHRNDLEWLEIETIGTKYRVRYEPRIESPKKEESGYRHVIAKKNAIIKKIESSFGQNVKFLNDYVKKGDIIVSGYISLNGTIQETVSANAKVYGEVWYEVEVFYPFGYYEQTKTGRQKNVYVLEFLSHRIEFFHFHPFYDKMVTRHILLQKRGIPMKISTKGRYALQRTR